MTRVGLGYDIHRLAPGRPLILAGVTFESDVGLEGHSDADVILHAVADAILGAVALGDIGDHFPPSDERWRDANSQDLLRMVMAMVHDRFSVANVDVTLVGEWPRIAPQRLEMRESLGGLLGIALDRVSIKATTNERLGALGRAEGIAALATVLIEERE